MITNDVVRPPIKCGNCGALTDQTADACEACGAVFGDVVRDVVSAGRFRQLMDQHVLEQIIQMVPNGAVRRSGIGGIGHAVSDHYVRMGHKPSGNDITWKAITMGMTIIQTEGHASDLLVIHPFQYADILGDDKFQSSRAFRANDKNGFVGYIGGMEIWVNHHMCPGYVLMLDATYLMTCIEDASGTYIKFGGEIGNSQYNGAVLLYGGKEGLIDE